MPLHGCLPRALVAQPGAPGDKLTRGYSAVPRISPKVTSTDGADVGRPERYFGKLPRDLEIGLSSSPKPDAESPLKHNFPDATCVG